MNVSTSETLTQHSLLVIWGLFAQTFGLTTELSKTPIQQKTVDYSPQAKVLEFFVAILAGLEYLQDLNQAAEPIVKDSSVARAWGQTGWAHYSGVSRTLKALSQAEVDHIIRVLKSWEQPYINTEVMLALATQGHLVLDADLTPRPVSDTSIDYPDVAYGMMEGKQIGLGYQSAQVSFRAPTYQRLLLSSVLHPGSVVSNTQTENLVRAAEGRIRLRPWRRTDLLQERLNRQIQLSQALQQRQTPFQTDMQQVWDLLAETGQQIQVHPVELAKLEAEYEAKDRQERSSSQLSRLRARLGVLQRQQERLTNKLLFLSKKLEQCQRQRATSLQAEAQICQLLKAYQQDNDTNPFPIRVIFRLDAGFGSHENVLFLIEMGYEVYSRPFGNWLLPRLKKKAEGQAWQRVGRNAEMVVWQQLEVEDFPYPLDLALERFHTGKKLKYMGLLHFGEDRGRVSDPKDWFNFYNARQTIEAGIKEGKGTFGMRYLKVRSKPGLQLQEEFGRFAANFVRFASQWLAEQCLQLPVGWDKLGHPKVKQQVQVGAHTSASVCWYEQGCLLRFTDHSVFAGRSLKVSQPFAIQLALPFGEILQT
jgi:hypothetical protein